jgi:putative spermidine/putrescine transport system substrate-binding protein
MTRDKLANQHIGMSRRGLLKALGASASAAAIGVSFSGQAFAQQSKVVIGTWGGDYGKLLTKNVETPFLTPKGIESVQDQASDAPRRAKLVAEKRLPRGTTDIQALSAANIYEMQEAGVLEQLDWSKIPNAANLIPSMKYPYGIGQIYSGKVIVYNPKMITPAPTSFKDAFDPKWGNKIGIIDIQYIYVFVAASLAATGGKSGVDIEAAKKVLLACKAAGARIYPTNEAFAQALKTEEIGMGIMWKARAVQWQNAGIPVESAAPSEGIPLYISGFAIPKNAPNKDAAYAYMNAMLEKQAQEAFAVDMGYNATVTNAVVAADLQKRIGFTAEEQKRLIDLDYAFLAKNDAAMKEWWDKVFKA